METDDRPHSISEKKHRVPLRELCNAVAHNRHGARQVCTFTGAISVMKRSGIVMLSGAEVGSDRE